MAKRRRRRNWSEDEKRMVCAQTRVPGVSVAQVARRYDVNANQVFNWLKEPRFAAVTVRPARTDGPR
ncbi:transposase [Leisingera sp. ANG59]|uniref:transposase n=1 Tax=Leisingera sp. ANG59 TaxID=2675221 RepID=UPI001A06D547|nr:transposase [Leisingera sp. ANG59]NSY39761.1 transposase [Leisingera sp. ANG59]